MRFLFFHTVVARFLILLSIYLNLRVCAFSRQPQSSKNPAKVLVTGAAGKTGRIILSKLEHDHRYEPKGLFRTEQSAKNIVKNTETLCPLEHVVVADITSSTFLKDLSEGKNALNGDIDGGASDLEPHLIKTTSRKSKSNGLENIEAMIICTSAVPRIRKRSLATMLAKAPWRALRGEPMMDIHSMRFAWKYGGYPEKVDYEGQIAQIDLAKKLGIPHVILISSMGGTDPENFFNSVGKTTTISKEEEGHGDILLWKRRSEKYLVESGLDYTILHPGHLVDTPGGREEFILGVNDELYELNHDRSITSKKRRAVTRISREDLADLCIASLTAGKGKKMSFDCITMASSTTSSSSLLPDSIERHSDGTTVTKNRRRGLGFFVNQAEISSETSPTTTILSERDEHQASEKTTVIRKSAEEVLYDFLDLSKSTNYDLAP